MNIAYIVGAALLLFLIKGTVSDYIDGFTFRFKTVNYFKFLKSGFRIVLKFDMTNANDEPLKMRYFKGILFHETLEISDFEIGETMLKKGVTPFEVTLNFDYLKVSQVLINLIIKGLENRVLTVKGNILIELRGISYNHVVDESVKVA